MFEKAEGIVIRNTDYGEGNKIITLYTLERGKLGMMARGAKKPKSRLTAVSQLLSHGYYMFDRFGSKLATLHQGELIQSFSGIKQDLVMTAHAAYIVELLDRLTEDREANPRLFQLLLLTLQYMEEGRDFEILTRIFEVKMLQAAGYRPQLEGCLSCKALEGPFLFSVREGGLLCDRCRHRDPYAMVVGGGTAKLLGLFQRMDLARMGEIRVKEETRTQLQQVMQLFIEEHTGLKLKSRRFLQQLAALEGEAQSLSRRSGHGDDSKDVGWADGEMDGKGPSGTP